MERRRLNAELWDKMHYLFRDFNDRMVHVELHYDYRINIEALKTVLICFFEKAPVLHSAFTDNKIHPYWTVEDYVIDDVLTVREMTEDALAGEIDAFLTQYIPPESPIQMKVAVFNHGDSSVLCLVENHMCMDGGDLKYFLATLCENYTNLKAGNYSALHMKSGSRSYDQVYSKLEGEDLKHAKNLYKNISKTEDKVAFPWSESVPEDTNKIIKRVINEEDFDKLRALAKKMGITVNDAIMAAVFRSLYEMCGLKDTDSLTVSCAIDLRKHIVEGGLQGGLTNHTAWMAVRTMSKGESIQDTIVNVIRSTKGFKRDKFMGLYSLPLLKLAYTIFPQDIAEFAIKAGYTNPLIAVSNMGLLNDQKLTFDGMKLVDGFISGAVKYKPFFLMSVTTLLGRVTLSTAIRGNQKDVDIANRYFDLVLKNIKEFNAIEL